jgi:hypothetical protein
LKISSWFVTSCRTPFQSPPSSFQFDHRDRETVDVKHDVRPPLIATLERTSAEAGSVGRRNSRAFTAASSRSVGSGYDSPLARKRAKYSLIVF